MYSKLNLREISRGVVLVIESTDFPTRYKLFKFKKLIYQSEHYIVAELMRMDGRTVQLQQNYQIERLATPVEIAQWKLSKKDDVKETMAEIKQLIIAAEEEQCCA